MHADELIWVPWGDDPSLHQSNNVSLSISILIHQVMTGDVLKYHSLSPHGLLTRHLQTFKDIFIPQYQLWYSSGLSVWRKHCQRFLVHTYWVRVSKNLMLDVVLLSKVILWKSMGGADISAQYCRWYCFFLSIVTWITDIVYLPVRQHSLIPVVDNNLLWRMKFATPTTAVLNLAAVWQTPHLMKLSFWPCLLMFLCFLWTIIHLVCVSFPF